MSKKSEFEITKNMSKLNYEFLRQRFQLRNGKLAKIVKTYNGYTYLAGYLTRAEIPVQQFNTIYVALSFVPVYDNSNIRFFKSIAMNKVITGGERCFNKLLNGKYKAQTLYEFFKNSSDDYTQDFLEMNLFNDDQTFFEYVKKFDEQINKYYKNKNVVTFVV